MKCSVTEWVTPGLTNEMQCNGMGYAWVNEDASWRTLYCCVLVDNFIRFVSIGFVRYMNDARCGDSTRTLHVYLKYN